LKDAFPGENAALPPKAFQGQRSAPILPLSKTQGLIII
jgi:hypothetical protein